MAASLNLPEKLFSLWTTLYSMEVFQSNYSPQAVEEKEEALKTLTHNVERQVRERETVMQKLEKLTAREDDLVPATPEQIEEAKRRLRKRYVRTTTENE